MIHPTVGLLEPGHSVVAIVATHISEILFSDLSAVLFCRLRFVLFCFVFFLLMFDILYMAHGKRLRDMIARSMLSEVTSLIRHQYQH